VFKSARLASEQVPNERKNVISLCKNPMKKHFIIFSFYYIILNILADLCNFLSNSFLFKIWFGSCLKITVLN